METGEILVEVRAEVNPTEDLDKVKTAIARVLGDMEFEINEEDDRRFLAGKARGMETLQKFHDLLRRERILDAARSMMFKGLTGEAITFYLNKQVAFVGHVSFSQPERESPLGPIVVRILSKNPRGLINWLTPKTL